MYKNGLPGIVLLTAAFFIITSITIHAEPSSPVSYHLPFETFSFAKDDWVEQTGLKTLEERKWELVDGRFGKALHLGAIPLKYDNDNMSGLDLDMVTAVVFNVAYAGSKGRGYDEPFLWGAGKLHPGNGTVAFWAKGSSQPEVEDARTILFEQTTSSWGRKERQLIEIELHRDRTITAYIEDARYVQHSLQTDAVWENNEWNHVLLMWDKSRGLALWINGKEAASNMGQDAWWDNQRPGLFHFPMAKTTYDEFYIFSRTLTKKEIGNLYKKNRPPEKNGHDDNPNAEAASRLKRAFVSDTSAIPVLQPSKGDALVFTDITPKRIHDEGIQGWWIADGRYELAWPHEYSVFTIIPGDVDFHAEKADIMPPKGSDVNYVTFEGNLDGVMLLSGDRHGKFSTSPAINTGQTTGFFHGATVTGLGDGELRIPFTKSYGAPPGFKSDGDVLRLPQSGDLRIHEVGIFNVAESSCEPGPGHHTMHVNPRPVASDGARYPSAMNALFAARDRSMAGLYKTFADNPSTLDIPPMGRLHLMSEASVGKYAFDTIVMDMFVESHAKDNVVQFRLYNPAVPSQTWSHAEVRLEGFTGKAERLKLAMKFDPAFLVNGDRIWLDMVATDGLTIITGDPDRQSTVTLSPDVDWRDAEARFAIKTMRPNILVYGRSFEYIPWEWDKRMPDVDAPQNFGGMFDMAYPWQAVLKVAPGDRVANIYKDYATGTYTRGRWPADFDSVPDRDYQAPANAPDWAVWFREFQTFRGRIVTWWRHHQRSDGQAGGGWNDDTLIFSRAFGDMPLDSNEDALALYNNVFDGFDKTNYFKDGYCRIHPIDRLHNGDFVRERYKSLVYNIGDPKSAIWSMQEAWHWEKPGQTPVNYGDGKAFLFGRDVMEWYWGRQDKQEPYRLTDPERVYESLRKSALSCDEATLWRFTEAWCHTDDQSQYGASILPNVLLGGWGHSPQRGTQEYASRNISITVGVAWPEGGGPQLGRLVEYSADDGLKVRLYSFDRFDRAVTARLYRLSPGEYTVAITSDTDGDGSYETTVMKETKHLERFDTLSFSVPPRVPVRLEITQISADQTGDLPDLAIIDDHIKVSGSTLTATVYNIGCAPSGEFGITVKCHKGDTLKTVRVDSIPGSGDFVPRKADVVIQDLPSGAGYTIVIDETDTIEEIFEENNTASILTGHF